jgi:hypothetical protein
MMIRKLVCISLIAMMLLFAPTVRAQEIFSKRDSISNRMTKGNEKTKVGTGDFLTPRTTLPKLKRPESGYAPTRPTTKPFVSTPSSLFKDNSYNPRTIHIDETGFLKGEYSVGGPIATFRNGYVYGMGQQQNIIGLGAKNSASFGYTHFFSDRLLMDVNVNANKLNGAHMMNSSLGAGARMTYRLSDRSDINVFGSYSRTLVSPMSYYHYGASISYDITEHFGMETGVNRYYDPFHHKWQTIPIVSPYVKLNNGQKLGFDFGGLLKDLFDSHSYHQNAIPQGMNKPFRGGLVPVRGGNPALPRSYEVRR